MEEKIKEAVEQALQLNQQQEIQELTEQVEHLQLGTVILFGLSAFSLVFAFVLFFIISLIYDTLGNHKEIIQNLQTSMLKIKRNKKDR